MNSILKFASIGSALLFVTSGLIKWINFPVDPTILFFVCALIPSFFLIKEIRFNRNMSLTLIFFLLFYLWVGVSCIYTLSEIYWKEKLVRSLIGIPSFLLPVCILQNEKDFNFVRNFYAILLLIGITLLGYEYIDNNLSRLISNNPDVTRVPEYLNISIFLGTGVLLIIPMNNKVKYVLIAISLLFIILLGARAPLVFLVLSILFLMFLRGYFGRLIIIFFTLILLIIFSSSLSLFDRLSSRFSGLPLIGKTIDTSVGDRLSVYKLGIASVIDRPLLGTGLGGFSKAAYGTDKLAAIHNIFLEIWVELGAVGLLLILLFMTISFVNLLNIYIANPLNFISLSLICICFFQFLELMVSSKMEDWRIPLFWLGVVVAYGNSLSKKS